MAEILQRQSKFRVFTQTGPTAEVQVTKKNRPEGRYIALLLQARSNQIVSSCGFRSAHVASGSPRSRPRPSPVPLPAPVSYPC